MSKDIVRLHEAARERWGPEYFITLHIDSTGDEDLSAAHTITRFADGLVARELMRLTDDGVELIGPWVVDTKEYIAELPITEVPDSFNSETVRRLLEYDP